MTDLYHGDHPVDMKGDEARLEYEAKRLGLRQQVIVDAIELEREACIRILEDMRPRNEPSDWNEFTVTTDTILRLAIEAINRRYPA